MIRKLAVFSSVALLGALSVLALPEPEEPHAPIVSPPAPAPVAHVPVSLPVVAPEEPGPSTQARLDAWLEQDSADPEAEGRALEHLAALGGIEPIEVSCGARMCRLEFAVDMDGTDPFVRIQGAVPWHAPSFGSVEGMEVGAPVAVLFVAREGQTLPEG